MARLDESPTTATSIAQHNSDHGQLAEKANYVHDVMDYGATGDGSTDDTTAIQAAIDGAAAANGGIVLFPSGIYIVTQIDLSETRNITLTGFSAGVVGQTSIRTNSAGTDAPILLNHTTSLIVERINIRSNDTSFSGALVDSTGSGASWSAEVSQNIAIRDCGFSSAGTLSTHIIVGPAYDWTISRNMFFRGAVGVDGLGTGINTSNTVRIICNSFAANFTDALVQNPGSWTIGDNTAGILASGAPGLLKYTASGATNQMTIYGNWCGDTTQVGSWVEVRGDGWDISGNLFNTGSSVGATAIEVIGDLDGLSLTGNRIYGDGTSVDFGTTSAVRGVTVAGNFMPDSTPSGNMPDGTIWQYGATTTITDAQLGDAGGSVGFYGTAPTSQQTGVAVTAAGVHAALVNLGLITA